MVNVPPIPPLLCSTPPPIDFGEEDEDVDVMPPTLNGADDDDYGDFLTVDDDSKNDDEPLPSPRLPSASDIPVDTFYDEHLPPDEDVTNYITPPSIDDKLSKPNSKNYNLDSINIAEAFNYNITNTNTNEEANDNTIGTAPISTEEQQTKSENSCLNQKAFETESTSFEANIHKVDLEETKNTSKNLKELRIETSTSTSIESPNNSDKPKLSSMQNMVSIEDIDDDLSDDELYSPKTPKNFKETDNITDYFKIHEIKPETMEGNATTIQDVSKDKDTKSNDSESSSVDNNNDYKSLSFNTTPQHSFDLPPPLDDKPNSFDIEDEDDDFGDFADFQDFNSVTSPEIQTNIDPVPASDINQLNDAKFENVSNYNSHQNTTDDTEMEIEEQLTQDFNGFKEPDSFQQFNSSSTEKGLKENLEFDECSEKDQRSNNYKSMENLSNSFEDFNGSTTTTNNILTNVSNGSEDNKDSTCHNNSSEDLRQDIREDDASTQLENNNFGEFTQSIEKQQEQQTENSDCKEITETSKNISDENEDDDDEFNDFADFEQHQENPQVKTQQYTEFKAAENPLTLSEHDTDHEADDDGDDDDDFGDFNTAQPVNPTLIQKTSLNITTTAAPPMLTPKNLNERISKILQLMFPPPISNNEVITAAPKAHKIQDIPFTSIDAAKALEYQWLNSDTRHSFIKSLAIDSRNILFGENWNPSLPRFAANLSFNPLKPMRPVMLSDNMSDSALEPIAVNTIEAKKPLSVELTNSVQKENNDLDWKSSNATEQTKEAFKDNSLTLEVTAAPIPTATPSLSYVSSETQQEPESLTIFENPLDNEDKFSNTPPISEMESVTTFPSSLPTTTADMELNSTQIISNLNDLAGKEVEEKLKNTLNINEVVATSTFTGSFKETHIYTPSKTIDFEAKHTAVTSSSSPSKSSSASIDFDFEKASMGVIIDETVVKKEYRDVEYNPSFLMGSSLNNKSTLETMKNNEVNSNPNNNIKTSDIKMSVDTALEEDESNDDFTEFQSVPSEAYTKPKQSSFKNAAEVAKPPAAAVSHGGMILSPAILIPQAIFMENNKPKPKIEWGDSTANINAEEMARIDELFPEPKSLKSSNTSSSSQKSTPTHQMASTPSISATVHSKELGGGNNDDDDWSEFVSVSVTNNTSSNRTVANNNILTKSPAGSPFKQRSPVVPHKMPMAHTNNSNNDDEWSDFVSSAPQSAVQPPSYRVPQFNSGAWQNANFYNNPLSMYHKGPINLTANAQQHSPKHFYNNNNNNNSYNNVQQQYQQQTANKIPSGVGHQQHNQQHQHQHHQQQHQLTPQQIHIMQNFSTAPVPTPERLNLANTTKNNQFQVGSAKVAPSIALIPDLGFVAPAIPTHTSFINSLPKPSINTKK